MTDRRTPTRRALSAVLVAAAVLTSCGGTDDESGSVLDDSEAVDDTTAGDSESEVEDSPGADESEPVADDTEPEPEATSDDSQMGDGAEPTIEETEGASGDLLEALLLAAESEAASDGSSELYREYLSQVFPCYAERYVEIFGDSVEPPYDAASVRANAESGQSLELSLVNQASIGPEAHLAALDALVDCAGGLYNAKQWDIAFQVSDGSFGSTATAWLDYAACILDAVDPTDDELAASHYYWYYDAGATDGPLDDPSGYFDLSSDLQARWSRTHGDSSSLGEPCTHPV